MTTKQKWDEETIERILKVLDSYSIYLSMQTGGSDLGGGVLDFISLRTREDSQRGIQ